MDLVPRSARLRTAGCGLDGDVLRIPIGFIRRQRWQHPYFGLVWVLGTVYMPVTAIW